MITEKKQLPLFQNNGLLPTGKHHVSFSEVSMWSECSWRHKLVYIDNLVKDQGSEHTAFGHAVHGILEDYLIKKDKLDFNLVSRIRQGQEEFITELEKLSLDSSKFLNWNNAMMEMVEEVPGWLDETFPGWTPVATEFSLFESIHGQTNKFFKGFIDSIIKVPKKPRKGTELDPLAPVEYEYYLIDWKTTSWGWDLSKKTDKIKRMQLALYKHYFCQMMNVDPKTVRCGFVLLKRTGKPGNRCELVTVSVGDKTNEDSLKLVNTMINSVMKGMFIKNRNSCKFCKFFGTKDCP